MTCILNIWPQGRCYSMENNSFRSQLYNSVLFRGPWLEDMEIMRTVMQTESVIFMLSEQFHEYTLVTPEHVVVAFMHFTWVAIISVCRSLTEVRVQVQCHCSWGWVNIWDSWLKCMKVHPKGNKRRIKRGVWRVNKSSMRLFLLYTHY